MQFFSGMTGHAPDFGMLMVGANAGIVGMTKVQGDFSHGQRR